MTIEIKVDKSKFDRMMADFPGAMDRIKSRVLKDFGAAVVSRATLAFRTPSMRPSPWKPRKPSYIVKVNKKTGRKTRKLDDHPLLIKSGALRQSIFWFKVHGDDSVTIMSDRKYAGYHQTGTKHMPARPFMPVDENGDLVPQMQRKLERIAAEAIADELRGIGVQ